MTTLIVTTPQDLELHIRNILTEILPASLFNKIPETPVLTQSQVTSKVARKILADKGYRASSTAAFNRLLKSYEIKPFKDKGAMWYSVTDLNKIPNRK